MPAYSGAELRTRDKAIEERHRKELAVADAKAQRLRYAYDGRSNELHAYKKLGNDVAEKLGFSSLDEIQTFLDIADEQVPYKDLADRVEALKAEVALERRDNEDLRDELEYMREERDLLRVALDQAESARLSQTTGQALAQELVELRTRLYAAQDKAHRSQIYFKERFATWKAFKVWMQEKEEEFKVKTKGMRTAEKTRHREALYVKEGRKLKEVGLESDEDPDNEMGLPETPFLMIKPPSSVPQGPASSPTVVPSNTPAIREGGDKLPKTPASSSTRTPLQFESIGISRPSIANQRSPPSSLAAPSKLCEIIDLSNDVIDSSQTEDDSQDWATIIGHLPKKPVNSQENDVTLVSIPPTISKTAKNLKLPAPHPTLPPRPDFPQFGGGDSQKKLPKKQRHSDAFPAAVLKASSDAEEERPRKMRRFSSPVRAPLAPIFTRGLRTSKEGVSPRRGRENWMGPLERRAAAKAGENMPTSTPANTCASKALTDYSAFKGRGRYGKASATGKDTINESYAIDPAQNSGRDFQYDAVVRGKDDRRRMAGGDCECCRDYYEAIGPLPSRLQPPLWRSPPASPEKAAGARPCRRADAGREDITAHKQAISRHRHNWARASTPPSYWHIGFPTTQEAESINEKAARMHSQKRHDVEAEAAGGGRYYKTK
ncbi:hypothetical protein B0H15DRAFT_814794 [Mycena belliarum]|uniref:DNA endonuclease activator Ctp1 C-terminal domain-containing protein n=1 Tax=Mycena belliarum TaxID=1033014 RepID=A0AAD6UHE9_9AGAR|nr:hypothetical protein B0H15DRAFT_814794 [Mycena belliae]